jgi:protein SCO1/2
MTARTSQILLILSAFMTGLVVFTGVFLYATGNFGGAGPTSSAIGGPFRLIDQNGNPITDADIKGRPFLVFFGYTHCPDVCPTTLFDVSEVMRALGKDAEPRRCLVHHRRPGARHARRDEGLFVELRSAFARGHR